MSKLKQDFIDLGELDHLAKMMYSEMLQFDVPQEVLREEDLKKEYYISMIFTIFSINSEFYMPYLLEGDKFKWDNFKPKYENLKS